MIDRKSNPQSAIVNRQSTHWVDAIIIALAALAFRVVLIFAYPFVYGGDPIIHLIESDRLFISYQLPGLQSIIYLVHVLGGGVVGSRLAVAALSSLAAAGLYQLVALRWSRSVAIVAALVFAFNPFVVYFSTVPYQFPLVLAAVHWGLYFYLQRHADLQHHADARNDADARIPSRILACSLCIGIACLTRYEAWILAACLAVAWLVSGRVARSGASQAVVSTTPTNASIPPPRYTSGWATHQVLRAFMAIALFGWAPILWLALHRGITPPGTFVIGSIEQWRQLLRPLTTAALLLGLSGPVMVAVAIIGLTIVFKELREGGKVGSAHPTKRGWWTFAAAWLVCSAIALVFSAHPVDPPSLRLASLIHSIGIEPTRAMFVTPREGHLYVSLLSLLTALGIAKIGRLRIGWCENPCGWCENPFSHRIAGAIVLLLILGHSVWLAADRIDRTGQMPQLQTAVATAAVVDSLLNDANGNVIILAKPIPPQDISDYLDRARQFGGEGSVQQARKILASLETGPVAYQRLVVHSRYGRDRLLDVDDLGEQPGDIESAMRARDIRYCVIFNDFIAQQLRQRAVVAIAKTARPVATIDVGIGANVYAIIDETP